MSAERWEARGRIVFDGPECTVEVCVCSTGDDAAQIAREHNAHGAPNPYVVAEALALFAYNCSPAEWVAHVYPGRCPTYVAEKVALASHGFWSFYGALDGYNRRVLVDAALQVYGEEARVACELRGE